MSPDDYVEIQANLERAEQAIEAARRFVRAVQSILQKAENG
jgi:hypothetical protein